jgi:hypothetical protein
MTSAVRAAEWGAVVACIYQLSYLVWFHRTNPTVLLSIINPMWFAIPLGAFVVARVVLAFVRGERSDPGHGVVARRFSSWMLTASLLQFPLRILGPFEARTGLELFTVAGIVGIRELDFGRARWIGPAAMAMFMACVPFVTTEAELDFGAHVASALAAVALLLLARLGVLEWRESQTTARSPAADSAAGPRTRGGKPSRSAGLSTYRWVLGITLVYFVGFLVLVLGPDLLDPVVLEWFVVPGLAYGAILVVVHLAFVAWRERGPGGTPRGAVAWQVTALVLLVSTLLAEPMILAAPAMLTAGFALFERRREARSSKAGSTASVRGAS